jgi:tetratricopeptide (TPR) repeat protein
VSNYAYLRNPREAQEWCERELAKPGIAQVVVRRAAPDAPAQNFPLLLHNLLVTTCIDAGELDKARAHLAEIDATHKPTKLLFFEGEWELAGKRLTAHSERARRAGSLEGELIAALALQQLHRFAGEHTQSMQALKRALDISVEGGDILHELFARSSLATMAADAGDPREALPHLERCRQIVSACENWRGLAGSVERAEAVVAAAQGDYDGAETRFGKAIATFQHYCLPWEEADTLQYWGRALLAAGEHARVIEKFDTAIEIYRSHGAGTRFVEYVMADQIRAHDSKSSPARV